MIGIRIAGADSATRRTNALYWRSDRTVEEITAELGISRSALYATIQPVTAGDTCPTCGGHLVYTTRTNRASHLGTCDSCGATTQLADDGNDSGGFRNFVSGGIRRRLPGIPMRRLVMIGGAAMLGAVLGLAAVRAVRET